MKLYKYMLIAFLFAGTVTFAQEDAFEKDINKYLMLSGANEEYSSNVNEVIKTMKQQYASKNVPADVWKELESEREAAIQAIFEQLTPILKKHYSHSDVKQLIKVLSTDTGRQVAKKKDKLTDAERAYMDNFLKSDVGKRVMAAQPQVSKAIEEVSDTWNAQLRNKFDKKLAAKGFTRKVQ